jgi:hypothetical protein
VFKILYSYLIGNETVIATFIGAFTAAFMGILASIYMEYRKKKREQIKFSRLISNELDNILKSIRSLDIGSKEGRNTGKLITSNNWLLAKGVLFDVLTAKDINTVDHFYSVAETADSLIGDELSIKTFSIDITSFDPQYIKQLLFSKETEVIYNKIQNIIDKLKWHNPCYKLVLKLRSMIPAHLRTRSR